MSLSSTATAGDFVSFLASAGPSLSERIAGAAENDGPPIRIIIGNEAGDADSIVSALTLGFVQSLAKDGSAKSVVVPLVSIPRADIALRPDVNLLFNLAGIDAETLLYIDDALVAEHLLSMQAVQSTSGPEGIPRTLTLVDHNRIRGSLSHLAPLVAEIVDHHEDEGAYGNVTIDSGKRTIAFENRHATVASTCTLVAERLLRNTEATEVIDGRLGLLLLGVILLDTVNMLPAAGRGTPRDEEAMQLLSHRTDWASLAAITPSLVDTATATKIYPNGTGSAPDRAELFQALSGAKNDPRFWAGLSVADCLRLDYKKFAVPSQQPALVSSIGLSSILIDVDALLSKEGFRSELEAYVKLSDVGLFGVLTVTFSDGKPRREMLLTGPDAKVVDSFADYLLNHPDAAFLEVSERTECADEEEGGMRIRLFRQGNGKGSRKQRTTTPPPPAPPTMSGYPLPPPPPGQRPPAPGGFPPPPAGAGGMPPPPGQGQFQPQQQRPQGVGGGGMPPPPGAPAGAPAGQPMGMPPPPAMRAPAAPGGGFAAPPPANNQGGFAAPPPQPAGRGMPPPPGQPMGQPKFGGPPPPGQPMPGPPGQPKFGGPPAPGQRPPQFGGPPPPGQQPQPQQQNPQSGGAGLHQAMGNMNLGGPPPPGGAPKQFGGAPFQTSQPPAPGQPTPGFNPAASAPQPGFNPAAAAPSSQPGGGFYPPGAPPGAPQMKGSGSDPSLSRQPGMMPPGMAPPGGGMPGAPGMQSMPGMPGAPGMQPEIFQENIDYSIQVPKRILRLTSQHVPSSASLGHQCKVPLGAVIRPLAPEGRDEEEVKVVQPGAAGIVRCKRCRTYINAFVTFLENGRRWRCNICAQLNDVPAPYFCHLDEEGRRRDRDARPELSEGVVEFVAPSEYMVRPPQPPSYFFLIDVSVTSVRSGMLQSVAAAISASLDSLPGAPRTQVGFLTYDDSVQFYSLKAGLAQPQMLAVADLAELFVPAPDDLLVNLQESREVIDAFLASLPTMFEKTACRAAALGPALKAAYTVTKHIGGKMCVFQSVIPTLGDGTLVPRENAAVMGTPDEAKLLRPAQAWYKDTAVEFSRAQISVDMFLFPRAYVDVASLADLPKVTAGTLHTYPGFDRGVDGPRFESELRRALTQHTAFEAVMRIRCTRGMRISNFYGNFFVRGTDLLALPNCSSDSVFAFDLVHDEQSVGSSVVTVQSALLYTSSEGERRIRVITQAVPVSSRASEVIGGVDADAVSALLAKQALDVGVKTNLDNARNKLQQACVDLIRASKEGDKPRTVSGYAAPPPMQQPQQQGGPEGESKPVPENLKLLPLYTLALMKNVAFRGGTDVHPDERVHAMRRLTNMDVLASKHFLYPRMFSLHDMSPSAGLPSNSAPSDDDDDEKVAGQDRIELPRVLNLTVDRLASNGIFLLDNGIDMFLWVGRSSDPAILNSLFGVNSLEGVDMSQVRLRTSGNDFASRLHAIASALREDDSAQSLVAKVTIVREGDHGLESRFFWHLIEDSASFNGGTFSYEDFVQFVNSGGGAGAPPGGPSRARLEGVWGCRRRKGNLEGWGCHRRVDQGWGCRRRVARLLPVRGWVDRQEALRPGLQAVNSEAHRRRDLRLVECR
ncbi:hypothetical protein ACHAXT_009227 [Thalassiosira profunda]